MHRHVNFVRFNSLTHSSHLLDASLLIDQPHSSSVQLQRVQYAGKQAPARAGFSCAAEGEHLRHGLDPTMRGSSPRCSHTDNTSMPVYAWQSSPPPSLQALPPRARPEGVSAHMLIRRACLVGSSSASCRAVTTSSRPPTSCQPWGAPADWTGAEAPQEEAGWKPRLASSISSILRANAPAGLDHHCMPCMEDWLDFRMYTRPARGPKGMAAVMMYTVLGMRRRMALRDPGVDSGTGRTGRAWLWEH